MRQRKIIFIIGIWLSIFFTVKGAGLPLDQLAVICIAGIAGSLIAWEARF